MTNICKDCGRDFNVELPDYIKEAVASCEMQTEFLCETMHCAWEVYADKAAPDIGEWGKRVFTSHKFWDDHVMVRKFMIDKAREMFERGESPPAPQPIVKILGSRKEIVKALRDGAVPMIDIGVGRDAK